MQPSLGFLYPEITKSLLLYRYNRLDGARAKALSYNPPFAGTMFPWESAFSGEETCPTSAATGLREDHISGDIAVAVWQEWCSREDKEWLRTYGYPILTGIAEFWRSIIVQETDLNGTTTAHIYDIIPPDEYVDHVNDSVYTNTVAALSLQYVVKAAKILDEECQYCEEYSQLADQLVVLYDDTLNIHPEYLGYPGNITKQADVILLSYPLGISMSEDTYRNDLDYYAVRTDTNGPAMTWGMFSIGYVDLLDFTNGAMYFNMSFQDNMQPPLLVWTETPSGNAANFITGAGGFLQTMIFGYPGIRLAYGSLTIRPICPEDSTYVKIRSLHYLGNIFILEYYCDETVEASMYPTTIRLTLQDRRGDTELIVKSKQMKDLVSSPPLLIVGKTTTLKPATRSVGDIPAAYVLSRV